MATDPSASTEREAGTWLAGYEVPSNSVDELVDASGKVRPHWNLLMRLLDQVSREELATRYETARRILREHGVTYNVYRDNQGLDRPWPLDLIPLLITSAEWHGIEAALIQRARLFNALFLDLYGPQETVTSGVIPAALIHRNPGFLRQCHGILPIGGRAITLLAVDLARGPDGQWTILGDRIQSPSGSGYALENRIVLSRVLHHEFREHPVARLAHFFNGERDYLRSLSQRENSAANVVLLSPGPFNETYFEHAFLARYLGFPLVEGGDLTVRNRHVFLKTLDGLQPVDVVLRRVDEAYCDPLELRQDSILGVAGLVDAARAGNVFIANALGSGLLESPALLSYLPQVCRHILGEPIRMGMAETFWCGEPRHRTAALANLDRMVIRRAFPTAAHEPIFAGRLDDEARAKLVAAIEANPAHYTAQAQIDLSSSPVTSRKGFAARPIVLRAFVCASPDGFIVMPGGLTRVAPNETDLDVSMQSGGASKDTWLLTDRFEDTLAPPGSQRSIVRFERSPAEVPSRVADNLYWLGRYVERLEDTTRVVRCILSRVAGEPLPETTLGTLTRLLSHLDLLTHEPGERVSLRQVEHELLQLIYNNHRLGTVREILGRVRQTAFVVRDRFSSDTWRIVERLTVDSRPRSARLPAVDGLGVLNSLIVDLAALSGMEMENMTRGHGWRFLDIGRRLERAINLVTLVHGASAVDDSHSTTALLDAVLDIADSTMTYRRRYFAEPHWPGLLELVCGDDSNPRSLAFQIQALSEHIALLPSPVEGHAEGLERSLAVELGIGLPAPDWTTLGESADPEGRHLVQCILNDTAARLRRTSDAITLRYFAHAETRTS